MPRRCRDRNPAEVQSARLDAKSSNGALFNRMLLAIASAVGAVVSVRLRFDDGL
jgi:hypothetical protein